MKCILCAGPSTVFFTDQKNGSHYFQCPCCYLRFLDPAFRLAAEEEGKRYRSHNNDVHDTRYQDFMAPILNMIQKPNGPGSAKDILDFGCGGGPVIKHLLEPLGFQVELYDPFFYPDVQALKRTYDFIAAVEVFEHLYQPGEELAALRPLLRDGGRLGLMTLFWTQSTDFGSWYYRRDPTHVAFYARETLHYIQDKFKFRTHQVSGDRAVEFCT